MAVTKRYMSFKLSTGRPRVVDLKVKVYMCLGRHPIPIGAENARSTIQEVYSTQKSHSLGPSATEADTHTFASLRSLQPRVLPFLLS